MHSLCKFALSDISDQVVAGKGGFTDVGQHTGSQRRNTCWSLVTEVIKVTEVEVLDQSDHH